MKLIFAKPILLGLLLFTSFLLTGNKPACAAAYAIPQNSGAIPLVFQLVSSADHISDLTGAAVTVTISKAGAAYGSPAGAVSEVGSGTYKATGSSADTSALGPLILRAVGFVPTPPGAPAVTTSATGGTTPAGAYLVAYSWVNAAGETQVSPTASVTTTGATSTITLTGATVPQTATGINVYLSTAGGGAGTLSRAGSSTTNTLTLASFAAGASIPGANTAQSSDPNQTIYEIVAYNPQDASLLGLSGIATAATQAALPAANATAVWGAATKTVTGGTVTTVTNAVALPTTPPTGYGGGSAGDTPGTTALLASLAPFQSTVNDSLSTTTILDTALTGTADLTGSRVVFTSGALKGVTRTIASINTGTGQITLLSALASAPVNSVGFSVVQGSKALEQFLAALGTDSKPFLTATDTQAQGEAVAALVAQGYTVTRAAKIDNADAATSSRMATFTYTAPANPTDYQQRAVAVTLPTTAPTGYGGGSAGDTPGTTTLLAKIGTPAGASLAADIAAVKADTGNLVTGVAALPAAVWAYTASDGLTHQQSDALRTAILARGFSVSYNAATRTQVTTYVKADGVTALATTTVVYDTTGRAMTRTTAFTNLP